MRPLTACGPQALGWDGIALTEITVFGSRIVPVVVPDPAAHRDRVVTGDGPQLDEEVLVVWEWPESTSAPAPAVRLSGVLCPARRGWRSAMEEARRWRAFAPVAVLAPAEVTTDEAFRWEGGFHGVGIVAAEPDVEVGQASVPAPALVTPPSGHRAGASSRTSADRWLEELLYAAALEDGLFG